MKIKTFKTVETEVEINFPHYTKDGNDVYAFLSEDDMLQVSLNEYHSLPPSVWVISRGIRDSALIAPPITADEFYAEYERAIQYIHKQVRQIVTDADRLEHVEGDVNTFDQTEGEIQ